MGMQPGKRGRPSGPLTEETRTATACGASRLKLCPTRRSGEQSVFRSNELIAGRFQVVRLLGRGGMGEVYEAQDLELGHRVAIKTLRTELVRQQRHTDAFKREVLLARQVTHPNICRIFDFFTHTWTSSGRDVRTAPFFSMELLSGETMTRRLKRTGPMLPEQALPIILQLTEALASAHRAGVLHLDLKTGNVVLVENGRQTRAVVTDFGLALDRRPELGPEQDRRSPGGTPAFMAPEQWQRGPVSAATDIFALGVVSFRMLTCSYPYAQPASFESVTSWQRPRPLAELVPGIDPQLQEVIERCLEPNPEDRYIQADEILQELRSQEKRPWLLRWQPKRPLLAAAAATALLVGLGLGGWWLGSVVQAHTSPPAISTDVTRRPSVAVMGFKNLNGSSEGEWISGALVEMLTTELTSGRQLRTIPSEDVARARIELDLPEAESFARDSLNLIESNLGAQMIVLGSYLAQSDGSSRSVRVDVRVQDTHSGELLVATAHRGSEDELIEMVSRIGRQLRSELGVEELSDAELGELRAHQPASVTAARYYAVGLERLRRFEPEAAIAPLQAVIAAEPDFPLAHLALADVWIELGYDHRGRLEIEAAHQLRQQLSRQQRMVIEARYHRSRYEWEAAIERYQALWTFYPDELEYGLRLAECQCSAGLARQAQATVERMSSLTLVADDPRIDLAEAQTAQLVSDYRRQLDAAIRAREHGAARGAAALVAEARLLEGDAQLDLGFTELAEAAFTKARTGFVALGDQRGSAAATVYLGKVFRYQGRTEAARDAFSSALETFERIGNRRGIGETHFSIGWLLWNQEDPDGAKLHYDKALSVFRETENRRGVAEVNNKLAIMKYFGGDLKGARALYQKALEESRAIGDRLGICSRICNLGGVLLSEGKTEQAIEKYQEALMRSRELGDRAFQCITLQDLGIAHFMLGRIDLAEERIRESYQLSVDLGHQRLKASNAYWLGDILMVTGELSESHRMLSEALGIYRQTGKPGMVAYTRLLLAELAIRRDLPVAAEIHAREALAYGGEHESTAIQGWAHSVLAQAAQQRSRYRSALAAVDQALDLPEKQRLDITRIGCAKVLAAQGLSDEADKLVQRVRASSKVNPALACEARLIQAELALRSGSDQARSQLHALAREARQAGFGDVANRAELLIAEL